MLHVVLKIAMALFVPFLKHNRSQALFYSHRFVPECRHMIMHWMTVQILFCKTVDWRWMVMRLHGCILYSNTKFQIFLGGEKLKNHPTIKKKFSRNPLKYTKKEIEKIPHSV